METIDILALETVTGGVDAPKQTTITPILSPCTSIGLKRASELTQKDMNQLMAFSCPTGDGGTFKRPTAAEVRDVGPGHIEF